MKSFPSSFPLRSIVLLTAWASLMISAEAQTVSSPTNQSWAATTDINDSFPARATEMYSKSGNRVLHEKHVEVLSPDRWYQPYVDTEKETVQENATTTRSVVRRYSSDASGKKQLAQVIEEEIKSSPNGESNVVRATSNVDPRGDLQVVAREVIATSKGGPNSQDTESTVYLIDVSGKLAPAWQIQEQQKRGANGSIETTKTTKLADGGEGGWKLAEVTEQVVKEDGENRTTEDRISRPDFQGNFEPVLRIVVKDTQIHGQNVETTETYSLDVPGSIRDGNFHLVGRVTTVQSGNPGLTTTEGQIEQTDPYGLQGDMKAMTKTSDVMTSGIGGTVQTKTTRVWDPDGGFQVNSVETRKSDRAPGIEVQTLRSEQPK